MRTLLGSSLLLGLGWSPGAWSGPRQSTPGQSEGPFYPEPLPIERDSDLTRVDGVSEQARGDVLELSGRVLDQAGRPIPRTRVEIWQCDANGRYRHPRESSGRAIDPAFQGYGHAMTSKDGEYRFRTIRPVPYPGRTPHIHFKIRAPGDAVFTTQMYLADAPENAWDPLLNRLHLTERAALLVRLQPAQGVTNAYTGRFEIVLGETARQPA